MFFFNYRIWNIIIEKYLNKVYLLLQYSNGYNHQSRGIIRLSCMALFSKKHEMKTLKGVRLVYQSYVV